jgi:pyridoxal phosphate enzyme (YggS family)
MNAADQLRFNLEAIRQRIHAAATRARRDPDDITLVAVTKQQPLHLVESLLALGIGECAENRIQDARERIAALPPGVQWHMIGHLQTNKAKYVPGLFSWVHSLDSVRLAEALGAATARRPELPPLNVLVQVNIAGEEQKTGAPPGGARAIIEAALAQPRLSVRGLMAMAPYDDDAEAARPHFRALRLLRDELQNATTTPLPHLSMGMTNDFEVAIEEGATLIRVGSALFEGTA